MQVCFSNFFQVQHYYLVARGYTKSSQGNPDEARAARVILKDYVNGKLLYVSPPPGLKIDADAFNLEIYQDERLLARQIKKLNLALIQEKIAQSTIESRHKVISLSYSRL